MTGEQKERLLGMTVQGMLPSTAAEVLGVSAAEVLDALVTDSALLLDLYVALQGRRMSRQALEELDS